MSLCLHAQMMVLPVGGHLLYMLLARVHVHNLKIVRSAVNSQMLLIAPTGVA